MADVTCGECGHANPADANYCSSCGAPLDADDEHTASLSAVSAGDEPEVTDEVVRSAQQAAEPGVGMLVVKRGPKAGSKFALSDEITTAGRHPGSDIFLDDITVSRRHAELLRVGSSYVARDAGSLNGTYVNRERIDEDRALSDGDELQIGKFKLVFVRGPEPGNA
ncbi:MAG: hypothetical protein JJLCMIEE_00230 [Acidimicrobiales bacterium]|nr:MAG: FHA domain-containing protein [Actinomycetota bacterium]MBV6507189.1 hypothetical protein [Acidimicrobiales bacterium]RIK05521.1 MAG: hypothetical protein DCC48_09510 [Acidobacteriota bacterium]